MRVPEYVIRALAGDTTPLLEVAAILAESGRQQLAREARRIHDEGLGRVACLDLAIRLMSYQQLNSLLGWVDRTQVAPEHATSSTWRCTEAIGAVVGNLATYALSLITELRLRTKDPAVLADKLTRVVISILHDCPPDGVLSDLIGNDGPDPASTLLFESLELNIGLVICAAEPGGYRVTYEWDDNIVCRGVVTKECVYELVALLQHATECPADLEVSSTTDFVCRGNDLVRFLGPRQTSSTMRPLRLFVQVNLPIDMKMTIFRCSDSQRYKT